MYKQNVNDRRRKDYRIDYPTRSTTAPHHSAALTHNSVKFIKAAVSHVKDLLGNVPNSEWTISVTNALSFCF